MTRRRTRVIAVEVGVTSAFVIRAAIAVVASPWLSVVALVAHGLKDLWQHRTQFVNNTRWWPPFCLVVDFVAGAVIAVVPLSGVRLHGERISRLTVRSRDSHSEGTHFACPRFLQHTGALIQRGARGPNIVDEHDELIPDQRLAHASPEQR
ncbi:MAG: hypothetical protein ABL986_10675 [Vicinamibacterales bacterium]